MVGRAAYHKYVLIYLYISSYLRAVSTVDTYEFVFTLYLLIHADWKLKWPSSSPWNVLGHVDSAIYGAPLSSITRRQVRHLSLILLWLWRYLISQHHLHSAMQVLEKFQIYGDSVLEHHEPKPNLREITKVWIYPFLISSRFLYYLRQDRGDVCYFDLTFKLICTCSLCLVFSIHPQEMVCGSAKLMLLYTPAR